MLSELKTLEKRKKLRKKIFSIEDTIRNTTNPNYKTYIGDNEACPVKHTFSDGVYVREMFIPKGMMLVGKIIKQTHHIFLMSGKIAIITEDGEKIMQGPCSIVAKGGTKRVGYALTDVVWINVHPNITDTQDLDRLEQDVIAEDYDAYNRYIELKNANLFTKTLKKIKQMIIKTIQL
jgi:hypothetical protein|tara:strand:+ start:1095 stop:1625 length:531 start_codon:yes stop_codon:yes gene_type:complete